MRQESYPIPLRPPHSPVKKELDESRGQLIPTEKPPLFTDRRLQVAASVIDFVQKEHPLPQSVIPYQGYL